MEIGLGYDGAFDVIDKQACVDGVKLVDVDQDVGDFRFIVGV